VQQRNSSAELREAGAGRLTLRGSLDFASVVQLHPQLRSYLQPGASIIISLKRVGHCNSAGLALLLQWVEDARRQDSSIGFRQIPASLREITDLYHLTTLLPIVD
jgi:phospholipid transport system transporter-binding protein